MEVEVAADAAGKPLAYVFKTVADQFVGQVSLLKVLSGAIAVDDRLTNTTSGAEERLHGLFHLRGRDHLATNKVVAGDLAAVAKLAATPTGSTLAPKDSPVRVAVQRGAPAVVRAGAAPGHPVRRRQAVGRPPTPALRGPRPGRRAQRGDRPDRAARAGDTHLAVALERLARKFGVNVETEDVRVPYRETITGSAEAEGKIKKQSGGHGQFAVAHLRVTPAGRGEGSEFVNSIVGGTIPKQYIPAVQRGVEEAMATGGVHGFPVVDVRVECYDGKYHSVDSSDMAFRTAAAHGLREALQKAGAAVLEPISAAHRDRAARATRVTCSATSTPAVGGSTARRRWATGSPRSSAQVPAAEIQRYAVELRSMTGGRGTFVAAARPLRPAARPPHRQGQGTLKAATNGASH